MDLIPRQTGRVDERESRDGNGDGDIAVVAWQKYYYTLNLLLKL